MTLDLGAVTRELSAMSAVLAASHHERVQQRKVARDLWLSLDASLSDVLARGMDPSSRVTWLLGTPLGPTGVMVASPPCPEHYTVVAVDGSQIEMDRHALASLYLLNTGWAVLHYGRGERATLANACSLKYRPEELYLTLKSGRRVPVQDELLAALRSQEELRRLNTVLSDAQHDRPVLALLDGNLAAWPLTSLDQEIQDTLINERMSLCDEMRERGTLLAGYISQTRGTEGVNLLRLMLCPDRPTRCDQCSSRRATGKEACSPLDGLTDADVGGARLAVGERSQLFRSHSRILDRYRADQHVYFFYLNVGTEIARIELPAWIAHDQQRLDLLHALVLDQCDRGRGYPPALTEAHEQAVVTSFDRELFAELLARKLGEVGVRASTSAKQNSKLRRAV